MKYLNPLIYNILYYIVLYCTLLYYTGLYLILLYCNILNVICYTLLYGITLQYTMINYPSLHIDNGNITIETEVNVWCSTCVRNKTLLCPNQRVQSQFTTFGNLDNVTKIQFIYVYFSSDQFNSCIKIVKEFFFVTFYCRMKNYSLSC